MASRLYERCVKLNGECVTLRLIGTRKSRGYMLERCLVEEGGDGSTTQVLPVCTEADLNAFIEADPYRRELRFAYQEIITSVREGATV